MKENKFFTKLSKASNQLNKFSRRLFPDKKILQHFESLNIPQYSIPHHCQCPPSCAFSSILYVLQNQINYPQAYTPRADHK